MCMYKPFDFVSSYCTPETRCLRVKYPTLFKIFCVYLLFSFNFGAFSVYEQLNNLLFSVSFLLAWIECKTFE